MNIAGCLKYLKEHHGLEYHVYDKNNELGLFPSVRLDAVWDGSQYSSWGVAQDEDLAFFKALIELIERFSVGRFCSNYFKKNRTFGRTVSLSEISAYSGVPTKLLHPSNSNGSACEFLLSKAREAALCELIERHVILSALLLNVPPAKSKSVSSLKLPSGYESSSYFWKVGSFFVSVCAVELPLKGFLFGYACSKNLEQAIRKASEEVSINVIYSYNTQDLNEEVHAIIPDVISSFYSYWRFSGDRRAIDFLENKEAKTPNLSLISVPRSVYFSTIPIPQELQKYTGRLVCVRAISPDVQQLFFDFWKDEYINKKIFGDYVLPDFPHFIA